MNNKRLIITTVLLTVAAALFWRWLWAEERMDDGDLATVYQDPLWERAKEGRNGS